MSEHQRWQRIRGWGARVWQALQAGPGARTGVLWASLASAGLVAVVIGGDLPFGLAWWLDPVLGALLCLLLIALFAVATAVVAKLVQLLAQLFSWRAFLVLGGTIATLCTMTVLLLIPLAPVLVLLLAIGVVLGSAAGGRFHQAGRPKQVVIVLAGLVLAVSTVLAVVWYAGRGDSEHLVAYRADPVTVPAIDAPNPSQPGPHEVFTLTYGSGDDRRPELGAEADLRTGTFDVSKLATADKAWKMTLRRWYWGFDLEHCPLNGRVWLPHGEGPFPLVLIVHGNHSMEEHSDPGYTWLGELLASRGFIMVSVDENFLNGSWRGSVSNENDARAWLLLEHLRLWHGWASEQGNPFAGKVDLQQIALMGHSRGGEAAAVAAAFNRLSHYPDDATIRFDYGYAIRAVVAIAPADGQYRPAGQATPLADLSYLVLQGAHDSDCTSFLGARQYRRVSFSDPAGGGGAPFKASVYSYRSNHGQFNTVWGDDDWGWPFGLLLNRKPLLDGAEQRRLGAVYISAFLEATLNQRHLYRDLLRDHRHAAAWLPDDYLITRYQDPSFRAVADFEEDIDVATGSLPGATIDGSGLAVWREERLAARKDGSKRNGVAVLGWRLPEPPAAEAEPERSAAEKEAAAPATYTITLPPGLAAGLAADSLLVLSLADAGTSPPEPDEVETEDGNRNEANVNEGNGQARASSTSGVDERADHEDDEKDEESEEDKDSPLDLSIELQTTDGVTARLALSSFKMLAPALRSRFTKLPKEDFLFGAAWEPTLQSFELPLARFQALAPALEPGRLSAIRLVFDRCQEGVVMLDDVGFAEPFVPPPPALPAPLSHPGPATNL